MRRDKKTQTEIAWAIGFSQAIVSKGLQRNRDSDGRYSAKMAQMFADTMKKRSHQPRKLDDDMRAFIREDRNNGGTLYKHCRHRLKHKKLLKSITTDNGGKFAKHKLISKMLKTPVFFPDPYSSWQKGTVENTNKLI